MPLSIFYDSILAELSSTNIPPERDRIWSLSFSPEGKYLATGNESYIIRVCPSLGSCLTTNQCSDQVWDIAKKHVRNVFRHRGGVSGVEFSADGRFLVSAAHDSTLCAWSMRDGSCRMYSYTDSIYYSLRLTPDGGHIMATDYRGELTVLDYRTGQEMRWKCHDGPATIAVMPNGTGLVTGSWDTKVKYWDLSFLGEIREGSLELNETLSFIGHCVCSWFFFASPINFNLFSLIERSSRRHDLG
jgi:WD40 repeat protein